MGFFFKIALLCPVVFSLISTSCVSTSAAGFVRSTTAAANDHIMYVRQDPPTFGHRRLDAFSRVYPDLGTFLAQQGSPDFLAETNKAGNRYLILYYLKNRQAFACRSGSGRSRQMEFSGPYPVTEREVRTLEELMKTAATDS